MSDATLELLRRWRNGERAALDQLLSELQPWLHREMSRAMVGRVRTTHDSMDIAQEVIVNLLLSGPPFVPENATQFRALLLHIARHELIDQERRLARSPVARHVESLTDSRHPLSGFGTPRSASLSPSAVAARSEETQWVRLALYFLEPDERYLLLASEVKGADWAAIASELGLPSPDAARMQCTRLKPRVARLLSQLVRGQTPTTP